VYRNSSGFTLIEFLVAVVILMVGMLGLLQAVNVALQYNTTTQLRNEAVALGDAQMSNELAKPFDLISTGTSKRSLPRPILTGFKNFSVTRSGADMTNSKQVNIEVSWIYKKNRYTHDVYGASSKTIH
jgi:type IV pilus assembly protein PilV